MYIVAQHMHRRAYEEPPRTGATWTVNRCFEGKEDWVFQAWELHVQNQGNTREHYMRPNYEKFREDSLGLWMKDIGARSKTVFAGSAQEFEFFMLQVAEIHWRILIVWVTRSDLLFRKHTLAAVQWVEWKVVTLEMGRRIRKRWQ